MVGATNVPEAKSLFATIDTDTSKSEEIGAIDVISTTIVMAMTAAPTMEHQNATVANARLAMGIALVTISLENRNPWLAVRKLARVSPPHVCEIHSYTGRLARHSWAECSENLANQKKPAAKCAEAYYAHD
jgi:hypothetical protein